jgi:8-oxo-dGTP pyrophosphatase MutT (NUDIX family)
VRIEEIAEPQKKKVKAGLLPYYIKDGQVHVCLMVPSDPQYGGTEPQISKGNIEPGEDPLEAAKREAEEELGFKPGLAKGYWPITTGTTDSGKPVNFFAVEVTSPNFGTPHFETGAVHWLTVGQAFKQIRPWQRSIFGLFWKLLRQKQPGVK